MLKETLECNEALQKILASQEEFTNSICSKNNSLQEQMAKMEGAKLMVQLEQGTAQMKEITKTYDALRREVTSLIKANDALIKDNKRKDQLIAFAINKTENLKSQLKTLLKENTSIVSEFAKATKEAAAKNKDKEAVAKALVTCVDRWGEMQKCLEETRASNEEKTKELTLTLETKSETIAKLMNDVALCIAERSRLETEIAREKKEMEIEREKRDEKERKMAAQIEKLERAVRERDQEIARQSTIIREVRGQKTLGSAQQPQKAPRPELKHSMVYGQGKIQRPRQVGVTTGSTSGDRRRFEALGGECLHPAPLSALRKRPRTTTADSGSSASTVAATATPPSRSQ